MNPFRAGESHVLRGIVPPLVTPLLDRDTLDRDGLERLIEHLIGGGVAGLFVLGTTGEAPSLSYRLRREVIDLACRMAHGRLPVLVGVTDTAFIESISLADHALRAGADALVLTTPYYFPAGQTELIAYVEHVVEAISLPLLLYNMPSLTKIAFEIDTLRRLADDDRIVGVKDSGGDLDYFRQLIGLKQIRPDWTILIGPETLTADAVRAGGDGGVNGGANLYPKLFVDWFHAVDRGDDDAAQPLQAAVEALQAIYEVGKYPSRFIKATKCGLSLRRICSDRMAEPFHHFLAPQRRRVERILDSLESDHLRHLD